MATLGSVDLGVVVSEQPSTTSNLTVMVMPLSTSDSTQIFDISGVSRELTINGKLTGTSTSDLNTKIKAIDDLQNASQSGLTYNNSNSYLDGKKFYIQSFKPSISDTNGPLLCNYTLELVEGT